jgi:NACalpha-BTF3-like transcription factor
MIYSLYSTPSNVEDAAEDFSSLSEDACEIVVDQTSVAKKKKKKTRMMRELESSLDGGYWKVLRQSRR